MLSQTTMWIQGGRGELYVVLDNHVDSRWELYVVLDNHADSRWNGGALCCLRQPRGFKVGGGSSMLSQTTTWIQDGRGELYVVFDNHVDSRWEEEFYVVLDNHVNSRWQGGVSYNVVLDNHVNSRRVGGFTGCHFTTMQNSDSNWHGGGVPFVMDKHVDSRWSYWQPRRFQVGGGKGGKFQVVIKNHIDSRCGGGGLSIPQTTMQVQGDREMGELGCQ